MRYCFVLPHFHETENSFSKLLVPIVEALKARGDSVAILSSNRNYKGRYQNDHCGLRIFDFRIGFFNYLLFLIQSSIWLYWNRTKFDRIHNLGVGVTLVQDLMTAHACHRAWVQRKWELGQYFSIFFNPLHALVLLVEGINYRRNIPVIAVCEQLAIEIRKFYPHTHSRIKVVTNGIPIDLTPTSKSNLPKTYDASPLIVSFASNDHGKKGLAELFEAMCLAKKAGQTWQLKILGHDPRQAQWEEKAKQLGIAAQVVFRGHRTNIREELASSDVFCLPSYYDSFGLVFVEAAQSGLPVIGTRVGIYPSMVGQNFEGLPLELPVDSKAIYVQLLRVQRDSAWAERLRKHCFEKSLELSEEKMVRGTLAVYDQMK